MGGPNEWDDFSRDLALAWDLNRKRRCATCNEYDDDWRNDKGLKLEGRKAPKVVSEYVCPGCEAIELKQNAREGQETREGSKTVLIPRGSSEPASPKRRRRRAT
jgi:hypothetical protein